MGRSLHRHRKRRLRARRGELQPDEGSAYTEYGPWEPSRRDRKSYAYCRDKYDRLTSNGYEIGRPSDSAPGR